MSGHMIDMVDPDSVDFHPLFQSINGAATTNLSMVEGRVELGQLSSSSSTSSKSSLPSKQSSHPTDYSSDSPNLQKIPKETNQLSDPVSRFQGRSRIHDNQYFSPPNQNPADPGITSTSPQVVNNISHWIRNSLQFVKAPHFHSFCKCTSNQWTLQLFPVLSSKLCIKLLFLLCTIAGIVLLKAGAVSNRFLFTFRSNPSGSIDLSSREGRQTSFQGISLAPPVGTNLPPVIENVFADVNDLPMSLMDTAIYWHIPRSAGTTMKHILATCLNRVVATEIGGSDGHQMDERLQMIRLPHGVFLNVDTTTPSGLRHAKGMGLAQSKMADVIFTPYVPEAAVLFDSDHRGRFFTLLREPVDRMISLYYYKRLATWEPNYNSAIKQQTLEDFTQSYGENWMVRTLTGCMSGPLNISHLNMAKEILRKKFLIGILDEKTESLRRFEEYFGWKFPSPVAQTCKNNMFYFEWHSGNPHPKLEDEAVRKKIKALNMWDVSLFEYGKQLFREQEYLFWTSDVTTGVQSKNK